MTYNDVTIDAKSIMNLMILTADQGAKIVTTIKGRDENQVAKELKRLFKNEFKDAY